MIAATLGITAVALTPTSQEYVFTVYYGDEINLTLGAKVEIKQIGGPFQNTVTDGADGSEDGIIHVAGVNPGRYSIEVYKPHDTLGKKIGITLWGSAVTNQLKINSGETISLNLYLVGGTFVHPGAAPQPQPGQQQQMPLKQQVLLSK